MLPERLPQVPGYEGGTTDSDPVATRIHGCLYHGRPLTPVPICLKHSLLLCQCLSAGTDPNTLDSDCRSSLFDSLHGCRNDVSPDRERGHRMKKLAGWLDL